jgi:hypothetical protein
VRIYNSPDKPSDRYENAWHMDATWREKLTLITRLAIEKCCALASLATRRTEYPQTCF